jgi:hypothetical protein
MARRLEALNPRNRVHAALGTPGTPVERSVGVKSKPFNRPADPAISLLIRGTFVPGYYQLSLRDKSYSPTEQAETACLRRVRRPALLLREPVNRDGLPARRLTPPAAA